MSTNEITVNEPTTLITDSDLREIVKHSEYSSEAEVSYLRLDSGVISVHFEMSEYRKTLMCSDVYIKDVRVCISDQQKETVRKRLVSLLTDIGFVGYSTEDPQGFEDRINKLNKRF